jgi:hypothetical protein
MFWGLSLIDQNVLASKEGLEIKTILKDVIVGYSASWSSVYF